MESSIKLRVSTCLNKTGESNDKFGPHSRKCIFVGYPFGKKGWRVYDLENHEVFVSGDVHFYEIDFPFNREQPIDPTNTSIHVLDTLSPAIEGELFSPFGSNPAQDMPSSSAEPSPDVPIPEIGLRPAQLPLVEPTQPFLSASPTPSTIPSDLIAIGPTLAQPSTELISSSSSDPTDYIPDLTLARPSTDRLFLLSHQRKASLVLRLH
ncbi:hypothetical protein CRG98_008664 [Punica granatum]|uniref:Retroviral polymerase SH3-like domain-containing protein n=1 Tax=Punica granatum TaxID=22663 RepID=A0A2I0KR39_PUNGR|nr:hypothetical protein CRG98_008664 [Punica granatum]